jgi:hypothetical protein
MSLEMIAVGNNWMDIAEFCADAVASAAHGEREVALDTAVTLLGKQEPPIKIAKQTLRTALLAYRFVNALKNEDARLSLLLESFPAAAVETLARWYRRDPQQAVAAARHFADGQYSLRSLIGAETESRSPQQSLSGIAEKLRYAESALERLTTFQVSSGSLAGGQIITVLNWKRDKRTEDFLGGIAATGTITVEFVPPMAKWERTRFVERDLPCAVLIVGPYSTPEQYVERANDWCLRALGLTFFHPTIALVLPEAEASGRFGSVLSRSNTDKVILLTEDTSKHGRTDSQEAA